MTDRDAVAQVEAGFSRIVGRTLLGVGLHVGCNAAMFAFEDVTVFVSIDQSGALKVEFDAPPIH
jgi:hypothetical protein